MLCSFSALPSNAAHDTFCNWHVLLAALQHASSDLQNLKCSTGLFYIVALQQLYESCTAELFQSEIHPDTYQNVQPTKETVDATYPCKTRDGFIDFTHEPILQ